MLSANQIAWFLDELFLESKSSKSGLKNKQIELTDFLHAGTNSCKLKDDSNFRDWHGQKWVSLVLWQDFKTDYLKSE